MKYTLTILSIYLLIACTKKEIKEQTKWAKDSTEIAKLREYVSNPINSTTIKWIDSTYIELDTVRQGEIINLNWRFKNIGEKPLIFANATSSCECTKIEKPKKPIPSGKEGVIKATFETKNMLGWQRKDIYLLLNNKSTILQTLSFAVNVKK